MRIYLAATRPRLAAARASGIAAPAGAHAHAVTPAVVRSHPGADEEEREHAAFLDAADAARAALAAEGDPNGRRVVLAADVDDRATGPEPVGGEVAESLITLAGAVPIEALVSIHIDDPADGELLWYDISELNDVLAQEDS